MLRYIWVSLSLMRVQFIVDIFSVRTGEVFFTLIIAQCTSSFFAIGLCTTYHAQFQCSLNTGNTKKTVVEQKNSFDVNKRDFFFQIKFNGIFILCQSRLADMHWNQPNLLHLRQAKKKTPKKPDIHGFVLNASLHIVKLRLGFEASTASFSFFLHRSDKMVLLKEHLNRTFVISAEESDESVKMSKKQIVRRKHLT